MKAANLAEENFLLTSLEENSFVAALSFLKEDARAKGWVRVGRILENAQNLIRDPNNHKITFNAPQADYNALIGAFRFFVKFMLLPDETSREKMVKAIESIERETLLHYIEEGFASENGI